MDRHKLLKGAFSSFTFVTHVYSIVASSTWALRTAKEVCAHVTQVAQSAACASGTAMEGAYSALASAHAAGDAVYEMANIQTCDAASSALARASEMASAAAAAYERAMSTSETATAIAEASLAQGAALEARAEFTEMVLVVVLSVYFIVLTVALALVGFVHGWPLWVAWRAKRARDRHLVAMQDAVGRVRASIEAAQARIDTARDDMGTAQAAVDAARKVMADSQADLDVARADMAIAQAEVNAARGLNDPGLAAAAQADVDAARADMDAAQAAIDAARADMDAAQADADAALARVNAASVDTDTAPAVDLAVQAIMEFADDLPDSDESGAILVDNIQRAIGA